MGCPNHEIDYPYQETGCPNQEADSPNQVTDSLIQKIAGVDNSYS
jgi:hypothetical protein